MTKQPNKPDYSFRNFPPDMLAALGLPVAIIAISASWILSIHGLAWLWAAGISFAVAVLGAVLLLIAKLPLYRQRHFFTFGIQALPESSHIIYRWGCRCSISGCAVMLILWLAAALWK